MQNTIYHFLHRLFNTLIYHHNWSLTKIIVHVLVGLAIYLVWRHIVWPWIKRLLFGSHP